MGKVYQYSVVDDDALRVEDFVELDYDFESDWSPEWPDYVAADAAEDYHRNHDGWEANWPVKFVVFDGDTPLGIFSVELEYDPMFSATVIKPEADAP